MLLTIQNIFLVLVVRLIVPSRKTNSPQKRPQPMPKKSAQSYPTAFELTASAIHAIETAARMGTLPMQSGRRRWYRDTKCSQHHLMVTPKACYFYRIYTEAGQRHRNKLGSTLDLSLAEARAECAALQGGNAGKRHRAAVGEKTAGEVFAEMMEAMKEGTWSATGKLQKVADGTYKNRWNLWRPHIEKHGLDELTLTQFTKTIQTTFDSLFDTKSVANLYLIIVSSIYSFAADKGYWHEGNPLFDSNKGKRKINKHPSNQRKRYLPLEQVGLMFDAADNEINPMWGDYWRLSVLLGARMGLMISMKWKDIDLINETWSLPAQKKEEYTISLQPDAVAILKRRRKQREDSNPYVFPSTTKPMEHMATWHDSWGRIKKAVPEVADTVPHDVRRTCGSLMTIEGVPQAVVGQQLGHAPGSRATSVYARLDITAQRKAANILGKTLKKLK